MALPIQISLLPAPARALEWRILPIDPVMQRTWAWCWAAVGEMVFTHYGVDNAEPGGTFQCGIVESLADFVRPTCAYECYRPECIVAGGTPAFIKYMLEKYPMRAALSLKKEQPRIYASYIEAPLSLSALRAEIAAGHPVIAGVNPLGIERAVGHSAHIVLVTGYEDGGAKLVVNDPGPYPILDPIARTHNPYRAAGGEMLRKGQYRIGFDAFVREFRWIETLTVKADGTFTEPHAPNYCCTGIGRLGPYPYRGADGRALAVGDPCLGKHAHGLVGGHACH